MGISKGLNIIQQQLLAKETKWILLEVRTHPTFLESLISKSYLGPVKLPGLSRNGPQFQNSRMPYDVNGGSQYLCIFSSI